MNEKEKRLYIAARRYILAELNGEIQILFKSIQAVGYRDELVEAHDAYTKEEFEAATPEQQRHKEQ